MIHDGTHGVQLNNAVRPRDQVRMPGPGEMRAIMARAADSNTAHFVLTLDVGKAHRRFKNRECDWGLQACRIRKPYVWVNRVGTFGVGSACYWWARLAGLLARAAGAFHGRSEIWQLVYADDLFWDTYGPNKFLDLLLTILIWECLGTPMALSLIHI